MAVETFLQDLGHRVVGPFAHLCDALLAAAREPVDAALLDVNLADEMVFPLAEALHERGVPFLLVSGCDDALRKANRIWPCLAKPCRMEEALSQLTKMIGQGRELP